MVDVRLNAIVDPERANGRSLAELTRLVVAGGATLIQLRDKNGATRQMIEEARAIKAALAGTGVPLVINDRVDVALSPGRMACMSGRRTCAPRTRGGCSGRRRSSGSRSRQWRWRRPRRSMCSIMLASAASTRRPRRTIPIRRSGPRALRESSRRSARASGFSDLRHRGHRCEQCGRVIKAGADGVAVISALSMKADPQAAARELRGIVDSARRAPSMTAIAVTIAGSDSGGGAGIQADLKTFSAMGVYGARVITALTAQNTRGVTGIHDVPPEFITQQIDAVFSDLTVNAVKIGMLSVPVRIAAVAAGLDHWKQTNVVLDPVMVATSGDRLLSPDAIDILKRELMPRALIVTPNLHEAAALLDDALADTEYKMQTQADRLVALGARAVLIKGGHGRRRGSRRPAGHARGRGAAIGGASQHEEHARHRLHALVRHRGGARERLALAEAVTEAKTYVTHAIAAADELSIGKGHGPVHHFQAWW